MPLSDLAPDAVRRRVGPVIFATVFLDMIGTGIIIPLLPFYVRSMHGAPATVGVLLACFSLAQLIATPLLGRLSDRVGRRKVVVLSLAGNALSMAVFAVAAQRAMLPLLFASRIVAGFTAGNLAACQASVADVFEGPDRSRAMGRIGAAIGLGIVVGPILGGVLSSIGPAAPPLGAALLALIDLVAASMLLPETLRQVVTKSPTAAYRDPAAVPEALPPTLVHALFRRPMTLVLALYFLVFFAMANVQVALALLARQRFGWGGSEAGWLFGLFGAGSVLMQAVLVGRLVRVFGEARVVVGGAVVLALGMAAIGVAPSGAVLVAAVLLVGAGLGAVNPALSSLAASLADPRQRGSVLGVAQSAGGLARTLGPVAGGWLFGHLGPAAPFWSGTAAAVMASGVGAGLLGEALTVTAAPPVAVSGETAAARSSRPP